MTKVKTDIKPLKFSDTLLSKIFNFVILNDKHSRLERLPFKVRTLQMATRTALRFASLHTNQRTPLPHGLAQNKPIRNRWNISYNEQGESKHTCFE